MGVDIEVINALYQIMSFVVVGLIIFLIVFLVRSSKKRNEQLKIIVEKVDHLEKKVQETSGKEER